MLKLWDQGTCQLLWWKFIGCKTSQKLSTSGNTEFLKCVTISVECQNNERFVQVFSHLPG